MKWQARMLGEADFSAPRIFKADSGYSSQNTSADQFLKGQDRRDEKASMLDIASTLDEYQYPYHTVFHYSLGIHIVE